jgi:hypothetical protein
MGRLEIRWKVSKRTADGGGRVYLRALRMVQTIDKVKQIQDKLEFSLASVA